MKAYLKYISLLGLIMTLIPALLYYAGLIEVPSLNGWMLGGALLWFVTTPFWMKSSS